MLCQVFCPRGAGSKHTIMMDNNKVTEMVPPLAFFLCIINVHKEIMHDSKREQSERLLQNAK